MSIRNFCIIAHIDHGKSTLADRFLQVTGTVAERSLQPQHLDLMPLERERGITIKLQPVRMRYRGCTLNLIDTPGHVDFSYEVSRSLAAVEGALLLVDATQGVQAQTLANLHLAREQGLVVVPVVNKLDLPAADAEGARRALAELLSVSPEEVLCASGKTGQGVEAILDAVIERVPPPPEDAASALRALVFDSKFDDYRGVVAYVRVVSGVARRGTRLRLVASGAEAEAAEVGHFSPAPIADPSLEAGQIGYVVTGLKRLDDVPVGDTLTLAASPAPALAGYHQLQPVVFAGVFCRDGSQFPQLREALAKLRLNDAALVYEPERSSALGFGFRCGFLGLLHLEVVQERLQREHNLEVLVTTPSVAYQATLRRGEEVVVSAASAMPDPSTIEEIREPYVRLEVITPAQYQGAAIQLVVSRRGAYLSADHLDGSRLRLSFELPLAAILTDFYDQLKSLSSGYASMAYEIIGYRAADVVRLDVLVAEELVEPLATLVYRDAAPAVGRRVVESLREAIPRQQYEVKIQAAVGGKIVAAERLPAMRKDVTAKLYGGDVTRKMKLLKKQRQGKRRMSSHGHVELPQEAYWAAFRSGPFTAAPSGSRER